MVIVPRDCVLLEEVGIMRVAARDHLKVAAGFTSLTRINARLLALTRAGLLRRFRLGSGPGQRALYALSAKGGQLVGMPARGPRRRQDQVLVADFFVHHQLAVNTLYCDLKFRKTPHGVEFEKWQAFFEPVTPRIKLIPDGYVELKTPSEIVAAFVEVDLGHERLAVWTAKARHYFELALSGEFQHSFHQQQFRVLVLVDSKRRMLSIRKAVAEVTKKIFWFATLDDARCENFFGPVWLRPEGDNPKTLFEQLP
jgi:hypothetical protein